jgi:hypothetical protein
MRMMGQEFAPSSASRAGYHGLTRPGRRGDGVADPKKRGRSHHAPGVARWANTPLPLHENVIRMVAVLSAACAGKAVGEDAILQDNGATRARRERVPSHIRPRRPAQARSPSASVRCGTAACVPAAAGRAPCRRSPSCPHPALWLTPAPAAAGVRSMAMDIGRTPLSTGKARSG